MAATNKQRADAFRRQLDVMDIKSSFADKLARCIERGISSRKEVSGIITSLGSASEQQAASLYEWTSLCLSQYDVVIIPDVTLDALCQTIQEKPPSVRGRRVIQALSGGTIRFFWMSEQGGDDRWYRRIAIDKWYTDDMVAVAMTTMCALEVAYQAVRSNADH